jgi:hypothetical protein
MSYHEKSSNPAEKPELTKLVSSGAKHGERFANDFIRSNA